MRTGKILASALQLLLSFKLMIIGALFIALSFFPYAKSLFLDFFLGNPGFFPLAGTILLGFGTLLFIAFYAVSRGQYYQVKMQNPQVSIDTDIIQDYADSYWKKHFPDHPFQSEVVLRSNQEIELIALMPKFPFAQQKRLLKDMEKELGTLLSEKLGYTQEFFVTLLIK